MDVNDLRAVVTLMGFVLFLVLVVYTYSSRRRGEHEEAAMLPFIEDDNAAPRQEESRRE
jgi:cytochrome c oxidase cbb3-type subunit 4